MFLIIFILFFLLIFFIITSIKTFCQYKKTQPIIQKQSSIKNNYQLSSWNNEFKQEKSRIYSDAINTLQSLINNDYYLRNRKANHILFKCIYLIFLMCLLLTSGFLLWMIIIIIEGITVERKIHDYIQKSSLELISFIEHISFITNCFFNSIEINDNKFESMLVINETLHNNLDLKLALEGVSFLKNIFHDLSIHLKNLGNLFHLWFMFTKFVILLPHVAGACSACNDLKQQKQVYNSFHYLITSIITTISHLLLYLITIFLRRYVQNHKYEYSHWCFSLQSSPILNTDRSMIISSNQNQQDEIEKTFEYQNHPIIIH
ncbi:unnamed protein product [Rotaria sp. Silwood2]|nr:unnamed protein product [Rotaria sp. Silwood2]